jgi:hypothetical protein
VRGLTVGALGALTAVAVHSATDFGLHLPANALLVVLVAALLPAVVTLRAHRAGYRVDLAEWCVPVTGLGRKAALAGAVVLTVIAGAAPVPLALAYLLELRGEATEAYQEYRRTEEFGRADWSISAEVARAYARQGHFRETVADEAAVRLAPQSSDLRMDLAALLARIGRGGQAIEQYRLVLARQPSHEAAHRALRSVGIAVLDAAPRP